MEVANVSVVMPNYNHAHFLPRAISGILRQTLRPREFLILDDGSTDNSLEVIGRFAAQDSLIRLVRGEKNAGVIARLNQGIALASSDYVLFASADDTVEPTLVEKSMAILGRYPQAGLSCGYPASANIATGTVRVSPTGWCDAPAYLDPERLAGCFGRTWICSNTVVLKRSAINSVGGFLSELGCFSDWFLNIVIAARQGLCHIPEMLAVLHLDPLSYYSRCYSNRPVCQQMFNALFDVLLSEPYRDVAAWVARSGALHHYGMEAFRTAATRPDCWDLPMLAMLNSLPRAHYYELANDADERVRALATFFAGPHWRVDTDNLFWKLRSSCVRWKRSFAPAFRTLAGNRVFGRALWLIRR
jgi:glycosyltransferase involved in cell wall biosynthesis